MARILVVSGVHDNEKNAQTVADAIAKLLMGKGNQVQQVPRRQSNTRDVFRFNYQKIILSILYNWSRIRLAKSRPARLNPNQRAFSKALSQQEKKRLDRFLQEPAFSGLSLRPSLGNWEKVFDQASSLIQWFFKNKLIVQKALDAKLAIPLGIANRLAERHSRTRGDRYYRGRLSEKHGNKAIVDVHNDPGKDIIGAGWKRVGNVRIRAYHAKKEFGSGTHGEPNRPPWLTVAVPANRRLVTRPPHSTRFLTGPPNHVFRSDTTDYEKTYAAHLFTRQGRPKLKPKNLRQLAQFIHHQINRRLKR